VLLTVLVTLLAGWYVCMAWLFLRAYIIRQRGRCPAARLVVLVGGQESAVEGFLRRLAALGNLLWPRLQLTVVVEDGGDDTPAIARRLGRKAALPVVSAAEADPGLRAAVADAERRLPGEPRAGRWGGARPVWYYDARGLEGFALLRAPLFRRAGWI